MAYPQNTNFDIIFEHTLQSFGDKKPKLLLHVCCAPCATQCLVRLLAHFDVTLFYANDNITDFDEHQKRLGELTKLVDIVNSGKFEMQPALELKLVAPPFDPQRFFVVSKGLEQEKEGGLRCAQCFLLRLTDSAQYAQQNGFDYFATTLTVSPYKNAFVINNVGQRLQNEKCLWLATDLKKHNGYAESVRLSNKYQLYRQHYCGCEFSKTK